MAQRERQEKGANTNCATCPDKNTNKIKIGRRYYNKPPEQIEKVSLADLKEIDVETDATAETETKEPKQALFDKCIELGIKFKKTQSAETIQSLIDAYEAEKNV